LFKFGVNGVGETVLWTWFGDSFGSITGLSVELSDDSIDVGVKRF